jgi:hypothetical protein
MSGSCKVELSACGAAHRGFPLCSFATFPVLQISGCLVCLCRQVDYNSTGWQRRERSNVVPGSCRGQPGGPPDPPLGRDRTTPRANIPEGFGELARRMENAAQVLLRRRRENTRGQRGGHPAVAADSPQATRTRRRLLSREKLPPAGLPSLSAAGFHLIKSVALLLCLGLGRPAMPMPGLTSSRIPPSRPYSLHSPWPST